MVYSKNNPWSSEFTPEEKKDLKTYTLYLHNDEVQSFNFVVDTLIKICNHDAYQAEQCVYITHFKGKCDIKRGPWEMVIFLQEKLKKQGLATTIE